jgi:hypothetical protein
MASCEIVVAWAIVALVFAGSTNGDHGWDYAHATFYGDMQGGATMSEYSYCPSNMEIIRSGLLYDLKLYCFHTRVHKHTKKHAFVVETREYFVHVPPSYR